MEEKHDWPAFPRLFEWEILGFQYLKCGLEGRTQALGGAYHILLAMRTPHPTERARTEQGQSGVL